MSWIVALAGFAGIMAVLSTVVTVGVEAVHKAFSLRRAGLQEMMRAMHVRVLSQITDGINAADNKAAAKFANEMTKSPSFGGQGRWWWIANWGINISQRRFERLSKRQFAEQLAETDFGRGLAAQDRAAIRTQLARLSYEFDRLGVAQSDHFRRRAKVYSGLIAFAFVAFGNVNAIEIYRHLAANEAALGRALIIAEDQASLNAMRDSLSAETRPEQVQSNYVETIRTLKAETALPIGRTFFPYCETEPARDGNGRPLLGETGKPVTLPSSDPKCAGAPGALPLGEVFGQQLAVPASLVQATRKPADWLIWLLSIMTTAGLLGLGAPFWFDLFARTAAMAGGQAGRLKAIAEAQAAEPAAPGKRGGEETDLEGAIDALMIASGQPHRVSGNAASAPLGAYLGPSRGSGGGSVSQPGLGLRPPPGAVKG